MMFKSKPVEKIKDGKTFGESALIFGRARAAVATLYPGVHARACTHVNVDCDSARVNCRDARGDDQDVC